MEIDQIDVFANYTVGISYVNSANRESDIVTASFLGSKLRKKTTSFKESSNFLRISV